MEGVENERVVVKFEWSEGVRTSLRSGWRTIQERSGEIGNFREKRATFIIRSYKVKPESVFLMARPVFHGLIIKGPGGVPGGELGRGPKHEPGSFRRARIPDCGGLGKP
jgi:hypothetical protein